MRKRGTILSFILVSTATPFPIGSVYAGLGASQFAELWYVFDHPDRAPWQWTAGDRKLAGKMSGYWVNFARLGDPNGPSLCAWQAFSNAENKVQYLADPILLVAGWRISTV
jgi:para-nitrobenzyl esterase